MAARSSRKTFSQKPIEARVESFSHDGRGVARVDGKAVFIWGALPGERVKFRFTDSRRDFGKGRVEAVLEASPDRVTPQCRHFGTCGGCTLQHLSGAAQIQAKSALLLDQLRRIGKLEPEAVWSPVTGPEWGYRQKARLGVKFVAAKGRVIVGFRERSGRFIADLEACPVLDPKVGQRLTALAAMIGGLSVHDRVPQIEVAIGDDSGALVFRILADITAADREHLCAFGREADLAIYLQRHGPESVVRLCPEQSHRLSYTLPDPGLCFDFSPVEFTQVNVQINRDLVRRVLELLDPQPGEVVLDLFCGLGNFTLPLAQRSAFVTGVEGSPDLVARARDNAVSNGVDRAEFHQADLTRPLGAEPWAARHYDKLLLDPSRAGALEVLEWVPIWGARRLVYVSCNPSTLARDAGELVHRYGYRLKGAGVLDMFPHTAHVESIALFEREGVRR